MKSASKPAKPPASSVNLDVYKRMNFLYQAAHRAFLMPNSHELARRFISDMSVIAKRSVLRMHPEIKQTFCKKCLMLLVPGITAQVRHKSKRQKCVTVRCLDCDTIKRFPSNKDYKLWTETFDAWVIAPKSIQDDPDIKNTRDIQPNDGMMDVQKAQNDGCAEGPEGLKSPSPVPGVPVQEEASSKPNSADGTILKTRNIQPNDGCSKSPGMVPEILEETHHKPVPNPCGIN